MALPGSPLFGIAIKEGLLPSDCNLDDMYFWKANLVKTLVPANEQEKTARISGKKLTIRTMSNTRRK
jgi:hypothetical protein